MTAHYPLDLPEGEYAIKQPVTGGSIAAAALTNVTMINVQQVLPLQSAFKACRRLDLSKGCCLEDAVCTCKYCQHANMIESALKPTEAQQAA